MVKMGLRLFHRKSHKRSHSSAYLSDADITGNVNASDLPPRNQTFEPSQSHPKRQKTRPREHNKLRRHDSSYSYSPGRQDSIQFTRNLNERRHSPQRISSSPHQHHSPQHEHPHQHKDYTGRPPLSHQSTAFVRRDGSHECDKLPTLRSRTKSQRTKRSKPSRRRKVDREREAQIKAMMRIPEPIRPATDAWMARRPIGHKYRNTKTTGGFLSPSSLISLPTAPSIRSIISTDSEHAGYGVSMLESLAPRPTLKYSSLPAQLAQHVIGEYQPFGEEQGQRTIATGLQHTQSHKRKLADWPPIPDSTLRAHKRVDDLADDLNASEIRELMERDMRRRELRKKKEMERVERRLVRRARTEMDMAQLYEGCGKASPPNLERGVLGRELARIGVSQPPSAVVTSSCPRGPTKAIGNSRNRPRSRSPSDCMSISSSQPRPLEYFHRPESLDIANENIDNDNDQKLHFSTPPSEFPNPNSPAPLSQYQPRQNGVPNSLDMDHASSQRTKVNTSHYSVDIGSAAAAVAALADLSQRKISINRRKSDRRVLTKKSRSKSPPQTHQTQSVLSSARHDDNSTIYKESETGTSGQASRLSWTAIFKWPGRRKRYSADPASFSNASRDSMHGTPYASVAPSISNNVAAASTSISAASSCPPHLHPGSIPIAPNVTFIRPSQDGSCGPRRTTSRFREDLPETLTPVHHTQFASPVNSAPDHFEPVSISSEHLELECNSPEPTQPQESLGPLLHTEQKLGRASPISIPVSSMNPSPEPNSISMASIDSEGSWFGGGRRRNHSLPLLRHQQLEKMRYSRAASATHPNTNNIDDEFGFGDDKYVSCLSPALADGSSVPEGEPRLTSSVDDCDPADGETIWGAISTPTIIHRQAPRVKSSEGLLNTNNANTDLWKDEKGDSGVETESDSSVEPTEITAVHRATSINLGHHRMRHVSAGSAKLLELSPNVSGEVKRRSFEPQMFTQ